MDAPDELVEAVAQAIHGADRDTLFECGRESYRESARAVLSVPALAEVIARDAKVRELVDQWRTGFGWVGVVTIAALYPEPEPEPPLEQLGTAGRSVPAMFNPEAGK